MRIEDQVCSLELAKKLKELGVKQESAFYWVEIQIPFSDKTQFVFWRMDETKGTHPKGIHVKEYLSAFTVAELGEMLPPSIEQKSLQGVKYFIYLEMDKHPDQRPRGWRFRVRYRPTFNEQFAGFHNDEYHDDTEANARAKMLVYLIEKGIIKP